MRCLAYGLSLLHLLQPMLLWSVLHLFHNSQEGYHILEVVIVDPVLRTFHATEIAQHDLPGTGIHDLPFLQHVGLLVAM